MPAAAFDAHRFDRMLFTAIALSVAAGLLLLAVPALVWPLWWLWIALVDGPHLLATLTRTYLDPSERARRPALLRGSLVLFLPGPLALLAARLSGSSAPWDLFLAAAATWAIHHAIRQHWGAMSLSLRFGGASGRWRTVDYWFVHAVPWMLFALFVLGHPRNRATIGLPEIAPGWLKAGMAGIALVAAGCTLAYAGTLELRRRTKEPLRPALFALVGAIGTTAFAYFVVGLREPLVPGVSQPEQLFLASGLVGGLFHGLEYFGILLPANARRFDRVTEHTWATRLWRSPAKTYVVLAIASISGYVALNIARGISPQLAFFTPGGDVERLFLGLYWGAFFHHYYLDQRIWRVHEDRALRLDFGFETARS